MYRHTTPPALAARCQIAGRVSLSPLTPLPPDSHRIENQHNPPDIMPIISQTLWNKVGKSHFFMLKLPQIVLSLLVHSISHNSCYFSGVTGV